MSATDRKEDEKARSYYGYGYGPPYGGEAELDGGFTLKDIIGVLRRQWELALACTVIGTSAAAIWGFLQPLTYSATAKLLIEPENRVVDIDSVVEGVSSDAAAIETQLSLLKSNGFLEEFVSTHQASQIAETHAQQEIERVKGLVDKLTTAENGAHASQMAELEQPGSISSIIWAQAASIADNLSVVQEGRSFIINITYSSVDPEEAAATANDIANYYIDAQALRRKDITSSASQFLEDRLQELEAELLAAEEAVHAYRSENPVSTEGRISMTDERLSDIISLLVETRAARAEKKTRLVYVRNLIREGGNLGSLSEVRSSPYMASLWEEEASLRNREAELRLEFGANHPQILALTEEQAELSSRIEAEFEKIVDNLSNELSVLAEREKSLEDDLQELTEQADQSVASKDFAAIRLRILEGKAETSRRIHEEFLFRLKETRQEEAMVQANTRVIASAKTPSFPSSSSPVRLALLGFLGSSALGFGIAYVRDQSDRKIRNGKDVSNILGVPCLGLIPYQNAKSRNGRKMHDYIESKPASRIAEAFRSVYTQLTIVHPPDEQPKVIQITSSVPDEGKTTFAVNVANILARDGKKTLLLDLDLRRPSVHDEVDLSDSRSFKPVLLGKSTFDDSMRAELESGCHVVAIKSSVEDPGKLLRSNVLSEFIKSIREEYDFVIIDGPPSLGLSDSKALQSLVDSTIFIVRWNSTKQDQAVDAISELKQCNATIAGAVLTQVDLKRQWRYGYEASYYSYSKKKSYYDD